MPNRHVDATLKDGTSIIIYLVDPCNKECILGGFEELSAQSRYWRFHSSMNSLSKAQLKYLTEIDNINHVAIAAVDASTPERKGIGIARYIRVDTEHQVAEFAITIADAYQGRGSGSLLLDFLISRACENEFRILRAYVLPGNRPMLSMLQRRGAKKTEDNDGTPCYELDVS